MNRRRLLNALLLPLFALAAQAASAALVQNNTDANNAASSLGTIATGVSRIRITPSNIENGFGGLSEIDVFGSALFVAPEPSTALMLGAGLIGLCVRRRRTSRPSQAAKVLTLAVVATTFLAAAQSASAVIIGPGASITDALDQDTPGGDRLNVDQTFTTLPEGIYEVSDFRLNVFSNTQGGTITPMLLTGSPGSYTTLWLGAAFDPTINGVQTVPESGTFILNTATNVYAGFFTQGAGSGIIALDANNSGSGSSLTDHDGAFAAPSFIGESVTGFSNLNLGRTYAFEVNAGLFVPEPSTAMLLGLGLIGLVARRRRHGKAAAAMLAGFACLSLANSAQALPIDNGSFEANSFTGSPGYISSNGFTPITGWTSTADTRIGLNPATISPFANNGAIPDGANVAFIQSSGGTGTLSQTLTGLEIGQSYYVSYRYNSRTGADPTINVTVGANTLQNRVASDVGGANPYWLGGGTFTATGTTAALTFANTTGAGDTTVLIDNVKVEDVRTNSNGWAISQWTGDADSGIGTAHRGYTHAINFGGDSTPVTINGLTFTDANSTNPSTPGVFSTSGYPNVFHNHANALTGGSDSLADDFIFGGDPQSVTIEGLVSGLTYEASFYAVGFDAAQPSSRYAQWSLNGDVVTVDENNFGQGNGLRLTYKYQATSNSMTFNIDPQVGGTTWHNYAFTNALVFAVPEPSTAMLLGLGLVGLCARRRRNYGNLNVPRTKSIRNLAVAIACVALLGTLANRSHAVVVTNGDFSSNATLFTNFPGYIGGGNPAAINDWTFAGGSNAGINGVGIPTPFGPADQSAATYFAFLQGTGGTLTQDITATLKTQAVYDISFLAGNRNGNVGATGSLVIADNSTTYYDSTVTNWGTAAFQLVAGSLATGVTFDGPVLLTLRNNSPAGDNTVAYSNIAFTVTALLPEPSTALMLGAGLVGLAARRRRRQK